MQIKYKRAIGKTGKPYNALVIDFGYRKETLFLGDVLIAEMVGVAVRALAKIPVGEYEIGEINENVDLLGTSAAAKKETVKGV